jgi:hypothetical protein
MPLLATTFAGDHDDSHSKIVDRYLQIWNQRDGGARGAGVRALFSDACSYTDPLAAATGHDGVDRFIGGVQQQLAGVRFVLAGAVDSTTVGADLAAGTAGAAARGSRTSQVFRMVGDGTPPAFLPARRQWQCELSS